MKHARADYDCIQDATAAYELAELVLSMGMITEHGMAARQLARQVLGISDGQMNRPTRAIATNGTTRLIPMDEPVFLIRGQDVVGGEAVRAWAKLAANKGAGPDICEIALEHAAKMDAWPKKKIPDLPAGTGPLMKPAHERLKAVEAAVDRYHAALTRRENGTSAGIRLVDEVQCILGKHWSTPTAAPSS